MYVAKMFVPNENDIYLLICLFVFFVPGTEVGQILSQQSRAQPHRTAQWEEEVGYMLRAAFLGS